MSEVVLRREAVKEVVRELERVFGGRLLASPAEAGGPSPGPPPASVLPSTIEEVRLVSEIAGRHGVPLVARGAGTIAEEAPPGSVVVRFDLMRRIRVPEAPAEMWVEAEAGAPWLALEEALGRRGRGLAVYPTSAPRATVGGWLATGGLGVGSFEYGRMHENVLKARVVLPGGELREVDGGELGPSGGAVGRSGIVVEARLRARRADADVPFAIGLPGVGGLLAGIEALLEAGVPLWHAAFLNPAMARARGVAGEGYLLFGAYPEGRSAEVAGGLGRVVRRGKGRLLPLARARRLWGERFFPVMPGHEIPGSARWFVSVGKLSEVLASVERLPELLSVGVAMQGTIGNSGEVLLLSFDAREAGRVP